MWFDWRMMFVAALFLLGLIVTVVGVMGFVLGLFGIHPPPNHPMINGVVITDTHLFFGGLGVMGLAAAAAECCRRNPDAGT